MLPFKKGPFFLAMAPARSVHSRLNSRHGKDSAQRQPAHASRRSRTWSFIRPSIRPPSPRAKNSCRPFARPLPPGCRSGCEHRSQTPHRACQHSCHQRTPPLKVSERKHFMIVSLFVFVVILVLSVPSAAYLHSASRYHRQRGPALRAGLLHRPHRLSRGRHPRAVEGRENIPAGRACIFMANHVSNLDPPAPHSASSRPHCRLCQARAVQASRLRLLH